MFSSYTCNRISRLRDYVEPGDTFCYLSLIVSSTGCLVLPLLCALFYSILLPSSFLYLLSLLSLAISKVVKKNYFRLSFDTKPGLVKDIRYQIADRIFHRIEVEYI